MFSFSFIWPILDYSWFNVLDRFVGGKGESQANIAEGLATALVCFEDLQPKRDVNTVPQKHCVLVCNSPPYMMPVQETPVFEGLNVEQLAGILNEVSYFLLCW